MTQSTTRHCAARRVAALLSLVALAACGEPFQPDLPDGGTVAARIKTPPTDLPPGPPKDAGKPAGGMEVTPASATVAAGAQLELSVRLTDKQGEPLPDRPIVWSGTEDDAFAPAEGTTDSDGVMTTFFSSAVPGERQVSATSGTTSAGATVTVLAGEPALLSRHSGSLGPTPVGSVLQIEVLVTDIHGNPVSGHTVVWSVAEGGGLVPTSSLTGSDGVASAEWTLGTNLFGAPAMSQSVDASALASDLAPLIGSPVAFIVESVPGAPASISFLHGDGSLQIEGTQFNTMFVDVEVKDQYDNPTEGPVLWTTQPSGVVSVFPTDLTGLHAVIEVIADVAEDVDVTIEAVSGNATAQTALHVTAPPAG